jgi:hypothetical protein
MNYSYYSTDRFELPAFSSRNALDEVNIILGAYNTLLPSRIAIYASTEITTGRRWYYDVLLKHNVHSKDELKRQIGIDQFDKEYKSLFEANVREGAAFSTSLRARGLVYVVDPASLHAPEFQQEHYHFLWEKLLATKIKETHFNAGWEYSNGCSREFAIATKLRMPTYDHLGQELRLSDAIALLGQAIQELKNHNFAVPDLEKNLTLLRELC